MKTTMQKTDEFLETTTCYWHKKKYLSSKHVEYDTMKYTGTGKTKPITSHVPENNKRCLLIIAQFWNWLTL